jgi:hypothetical protein
VDVILLGLVVVLSAMYLASVGPYWNISPDSATYVGWARSLLAGNGFGDSPFHPPVTSLLFAIPLAIQPDGYLLLNLLNTLLMLVGMGLALLVVRRRASRTVAQACVVLALAYREAYHESTQLLSEPAYFCLSFLALFVLDKGSDADGDLPLRSQWLAAVLLVAVAMTRTIGLTLAAAVLIAEGVELVRHRRPLRPVLVGGAIAALVSLALWEAWTTRFGASTKFEMFLLRDAWSPASGVQGPGELLSRMLSNVGRLPDAGGVLLNKASTGIAAIDVTLGTGTVLLLVSGVVLSMRRRLGVLELYMCSYCAVVVAHVLEGGFHPYRHLVPVIPLVFLFAAEAVQAAVQRMPSWVPGPLSRLAVLAGVSVYVILGLCTAREGVRAEHDSPFGNYPIKRASNFDAQRVALRLRNISLPGERYATAQVHMYDIITERDGRAIPPTARASEAAWVDWLLRERIGHVIVDHRAAAVGDSVVAFMRRRPADFGTVLELPGASLYAVRRSRD